MYTPLPQQIGWIDQVCLYNNNSKTLPDNRHGTQGDADGEKSINNVIQNRFHLGVSDLGSETSIVIQNLFRSRLITPLRNLFVNSIGSRK